jgi:hypothetical protein
MTWDILKRNEHVGIFGLVTMEFELALKSMHYLTIRLLEVVVRSECLKYSQ